MAIGEVDLMALSEVIAGLEDQLGRAINYLTLSRAELVGRAEAGEPFIMNVLSGPKIMLIGQENALRAIATAGAH
jgi:hypothetical protein